MTVPDVIAEDETGDPTTLSARLAAVSGIVSSATVDGIPAVFAKADGPLNAGLLFRVGWADETFATAGITHLVEHLALAPLSSTDTPHNGATSDHFTHFHVQGTEAQVVEHLNGLCASLRDLPLSRLETEKEILRTEGSRRAAGPAEFGAAERWGARGFGLNLYGEPGLSRIDAAAVQEWVRTRFTAGNAVLWITAPALPAGLDLALPSGPRHPIAFGDEVVMRKPAYTVGQTGGVYIEAFVPRSSAAALFARVASRMLFRDLRQIGGYSYVAESRYEPVDPDRARIVVVADALEQQQAAVVGGAVDVLAALRAGAIEDADLAAAKESLRVRSDTALLGGALLPWFAQSLLDGTEILGLDALDRERDAVTVEDIASVATQFHADAVAQVPEGDLEWAGFSPLPRWSETVVDGTEYPRPDEENVALVVGGRGVSLKVGFHAATVMFGDCVGLLVYPDGARVLVGGDGFRVVVEPTLHDGLSAAIVATSIDAVIPDELHIPMPARSPEQIPARPAPAPRPGWRGFGKWATWTSWILTALAIFSLWITIRMALGLTESSPGSIGEGFIVAGVLFVFAVIFGAGAYARNEYKKSHAPGS